MTILFDNVVGSVSAGNSPESSVDGEPKGEPEAAPPPIDTQRMLKELRLIAQREARLHAD
jgi:hypothetical protein